MTWGWFYRWIERLHDGLEFEDRGTIFCTFSHYYTQRNKRKDIEYPCLLHLQTCQKTAKSSVFLPCNRVFSVIKPDSHDFKFTMVFTVSIFCQELASFEDSHKHLFLGKRFIFLINSSFQHQIRLALKNHDFCQQFQDKVDLSSQKKASIAEEGRERAMGRQINQSLYVFLTLLIPHVFLNRTSYIDLIEHIIFNERIKATNLP